ncbi:VirB4 Type IV secretory pathway, VirB4 components [Comamonadaceae bacterium]
MSGKSAKGFGLLPEDAVRDHLESLLNYNFCGELHGLDDVYDLREGGYGYALRVTVPAIECLDGGAGLCASVINTVICSLNKDYTCQIVRRTVSNIRHQMELYAGVDSVGAMPEAFAQQRLDQFSNASNFGFTPDLPEYNFFPGTEELYFFISTPNLEKFSVEKILRGGAQHIEDQIQAFRASVAAIKDVLRNVGLRYQVLNASLFVEYVVSFLNPRMLEDEEYRPSVKPDEVALAISRAVTLEELDSKIGFVSHHHDTKTHFRAISMLWQPDGVKPGMLDEAVAKERDCAFVMTVRILDTKSEQFRLKAKRYLASKMRIGSFNAEEINEMEASIGDALSRVVNGERFVDARLTIVVTDSSKRGVDDRTASIQSLLTRCGLQYTDVERDIGHSIIINGCLPFPRRDYERAFQRSKRMLSADIAELTPVGGTWPGVEDKPYALYPNRSGRPTLLNPLSGSKNSNLLVVAESGGGKSFWINDFLAQTARLPGAFQFIISTKPDYRKWANLFGKEVELTLENCPSISPFWGEVDNNSIDFWSKLVLGMVHDDRTKSADIEVKQAISRAVTVAAQKLHAASEGYAELQLADIQLALTNESTALGDKLSNALYDYLDNGRYAKMFQGDSQIKPTIGNRIFFNLAGIMATDAGPTALMCVMRTIDSVMSDPRLRGVPKVAIFDEGWSVIGTDYGAAFIDRAVRTYRSLGGMVGFITQDPRDLDTPMGRSVLNNTSTKVVLPLAKAAADSLPTFMDLSESEKEAIASLRPVKGVYSEFFIQMSGLGSTVARLAPFPLLYSMNTTDPDDEAVQFKMLEAGLSHADMIEQFAHQYPRGVAAARNTHSGVSA